MGPPDGRFSSQEVPGHLVSFPGPGKLTARLRAAAHGRAVEVTSGASYLMGSEGVRSVTGTVVAPAEVVSSAGAVSATSGSGS
jgi:hypothetical protein